MKVLHWCISGVKTLQQPIDFWKNAETAKTPFVFVFCLFLKKGIFKKSLKRKELIQYQDYVSVADTLLSDMSCPFIFFLFNSGEHPHRLRWRLTFDFNSQQPDSLPLLGRYLKRFVMVPIMVNTMFNCSCIFVFICQHATFSDHLSMLAPQNNMGHQGSATKTSPRLFMSQLNAHTTFPVSPEAIGWLRKHE